MSSAERRTRIAALPDIGQCSGEARADAAPLTTREHACFVGLYREHFDFVFRNLRRLGVSEAAIDDALQDVYLAALRHIADFRDDTHPKAWLFAIAMRVASNHRRGQRRRGDPLALEADQIGTSLPSPFELTAQAEARHILQGFLDTLDEKRRACFVMAELEQMTAPEIAQALSANLNTVYSWLRITRIEFVRRLEQLNKETNKPRG
jgi:RNA polymerase sigma-70 factor (ECF subfamily)